MQPPSDLPNDIKQKKIILDYFSKHMGEYFPLQRLSYVPNDIKQKMIFDYFSKHMSAFQELVEMPFTFDVNRLFTLDPFFQVSYLDWNKFCHSDKGKGEFGKLINEKIGDYRKTFEPTNADGFNLCVLVAWALLEKNKLIDPKRKFFLFFQYFFNSPLPKRITRELFVKLENMQCDFIENAFKTGNNGLFDCYLYSNNGCIRKSTFGYLKKKLESLDEIQNNFEKKFLISLYITIFGMKDDLLIQEKLKQSFNQWFEKNNFLEYQNEIDVFIKGETSHLWKLYSMLGFKDIEEQWKLSFFEKYCSTDQRPRLKLGYCYQPFLKDLQILLSGISRDNHDFFLIELFQKNSFIPFFLHGYYQNEFETLDEIVSSLVKRTECYHEDIAKQMGLAKYVMHYNKLITDLGLIDGDLCNMYTRGIRNSYSKVNPFYRFSDGKFLFEKFFSYKSDELTFKNTESSSNCLGNWRYFAVQRALIENLIDRKYKFSNDVEIPPSFPIERVVDIIKSIISSDKKGLNSIDQIINAYKQEANSWSVLCLPFIITLTDQLKDAIAVDPDLVKDIRLVKVAFSLMHESWKIENWHREKVKKFLSEIIGPEKREFLPSPSEPIQKTKILPKSINQPEETTPSIIDLSQEPSNLQKALKTIKQLWRNHPFLRITCGSIVSYITVKSLYLLYKKMVSA